MRSMQLSGLLICAPVLLAQDSSRFKPFTPIQVYEVRRGILALPTYTGSGRLCRIVLQKEAYTDEVVNLDPAMAETPLELALKDLVPASERLRSPNGLGSRPLNVITGTSVTRIENFRDLTIKRFSNVSLKPAGTIAAIVEWKTRKCIGE